mgnify:CR=1 FL=1
MALTLVIGNKNYSSWSFRPWIALRTAAIPFEEVVIPLYEPGSKERILSVLCRPARCRCSSMATCGCGSRSRSCDYLAERFPQTQLWPKDCGRACACPRGRAPRCTAGFAPLRRHCPMNMWRPVKARELLPEAAADVRRIDAIFTECRERFGQGGAFLFGAFGAAGCDVRPGGVAAAHLWHRGRPGRGGLQAGHHGAIRN